MNMVKNTYVKSEVKWNQEFYNAKIVYGEKVINTGIWATSKEDAWDKLYFKHLNADKVEIIN